MKSEGEITVQDMSAAASGTPSFSPMSAVILTTNRLILDLFVVLATNTLYLRIQVHLVPKCSVSIGARETDSVRGLVGMH